jgi:hypothetical protein
MNSIPTFGWDIQNQKMAHGRVKLWTVGAKRYSTEQNSQVETQKTKKQTKWKQNPHY